MNGDEKEQNDLDKLKQTVDNGWSESNQSTQTVQGDGDKAVADQHNNCSNGTSKELTASSSPVSDSESICSNISDQDLCTQFFDGIKMSDNSVKIEGEAASSDSSVEPRTFLKQCLYLLIL